MTRLLKQLVYVVLIVLLLGCAGGTAGSGGVEVRGKVTSEQDLPIEGALVEILSLENEPIAATSSDALGEFVFSDVTERAGEIRITLPSREQPVVSSFSIPEGRDTAVVRVRDDSREGPTARVEYPEKDEPSEDDGSEDKPDRDDEDEPDDDQDFDNDEVEERPEEEDYDDSDDAPVMDDENDDSEDVNDDVTDEDDGSEQPHADNEDETELDDDPSAPAEVEED